MHTFTSTDNHSIVGYSDYIEQGGSRYNSFFLPQYDTDEQSVECANRALKRQCCRKGSMWSYEHTCTHGESSSPNWSARMTLPNMVSTLSGLFRDLMRTQP